MMRISEKGIDLIKRFEGLRLKAYRDSAGVWTIGYGSTKYSDGNPIKSGNVLENEQQASTLLNSTLAVYENAVNRNVTVPINQNQFDALVSLAYNVGTGIMLSSTLIKKLNSSDYHGAADQFLVWDKITNPLTQKKVVLNTLMIRRTKERDLFLNTYPDDRQTT